jgi:hypothetical protein
MRPTEAELTEATVYARAGELDQALTQTEQAFERGRRLLPSILLVGHEGADELARTYPNSSAATELVHHLRILAGVA